MGIKTGEEGKLIVVNADFDLSANNDLKLVFTAPSTAKFTVDKAGGVSAPAVDFIDPDTGEVLFNANEYWSYATTATDFTESGLWAVHGEYYDATPKKFCGETDSFTILPCG